MQDTLSLYLPMDLRQALAKGSPLPDRVQGAALFADISGFTALTEALSRELGPQRGAEELTRHLSKVYDAVICELDLYGGSVIGFAGDAVTCWLDGDDGIRATACALAMQQAMARFTAFVLPSGSTVSQGMKVGVAVGSARRFLIGDPAIQVRDVLAGSILDQLAAAERVARAGEVVLEPETATSLAWQVDVKEWRPDDETGAAFGIVDSLLVRPRATPWDSLPPGALSDEIVRPFLIPAVYDSIRSGQGDFLAELRPAVALFLHFGGIDYDHDEGAGARLDAFVREVQGILAEYDGNLIQLIMGDKGSYIYAAFGAPHAHEDDAVRAISAAYRLRTAGAGQVSGVKIGVAQGIMRTGAYGGQTRRTYDVLGDAVNLAARLMQAAKPGQVLAPDQLAQVTASAFAWENLPEISVKGKRATVQISSLIGPSLRRGRVVAAVSSEPMVGREAELALVEDRMTAALGGQGHIIGITGEAGMGKTRLVAEVIRRAQARGMEVLSGQCESYGVNTSYLVWQSIWRAFFDMDAVQSANGVDYGSEAVVEHLSRQLAQIDERLALRAPLLATVLNIIIPDNDLTRSFDAKLRKASLESLLEDCMRARVARGPVLLVLDECHWIDPLSHDLLEIIGRLAARLPLLIVTAYRPPELHVGGAVGAQRLSVSQLAHFSEVRLAGFSPEEANRLIGLKLEGFFGSRFEVPVGLVQRITARAEGNPFYISELLNYLQDRGVSPHDPAGLAQLDLPTSLHRLILARMDQLSESQRTTMRVASVIGRQFRAAVLLATCPQCGNPATIRSDLDVLSRLELTLIEAEPNLTYFFKHIVTQEVAYESLPYATRSLLHGEIGEFLERIFGGDVDQYLDLLAFHFDRSENVLKRIEYLVRAGRAAQSTYANAAAIDYYRRALPLLEEQDRPETMLRLGQVLELTGEWTEATDTYRSGLDLAVGLGDELAVARYQTALGELQRKQGMYEEATDWLEKARARFEGIGDAPGVGQVLHIEGSVAAQQGDFQQARRLYEQSLSVRRRLDDQPQIANLLSNLGIVARSLGEPGRARALYEESLSIRRDLNDRRAIAVSLNNLGNLALQRQDFDAARGYLEEAVSLQREVGDKHYLANALNNLGNVARSQGDYPSSLVLYDESLVLNWELGDAWQLAYLFEDIGSLAAAQGKPHRALRLVGAALALRETIGAPRSASEQANIDRNIEPARRGLSEAEQALLLAEGQALTLEQAFVYARAAPDSNQPDSR